MKLILIHASVKNWDADSPMIFNMEDVIKLTEENLESMSREQQTKM
jgi:hypothetical protein